MAEMKAKIHAVTIGGVTRLVMAQTKQGAVRDAIASIVEQARDNAEVEIATPEQIYYAGMRGEPVLNAEQFGETTPVQVGPEQIDAFADEMATQGGAAANKAFSDGTPFDPAAPENAAWAAQGQAERA